MDSTFKSSSYCDDETLTSSICRVNVQAPMGADAALVATGKRLMAYSSVMIRLGAPLMTGHYSEGQTQGDTDFSMLSHVCQSSLIMQIQNVPSKIMWPPIGCVQTTGSFQPSLLLIFSYYQIHTKQQTNNKNQLTTQLPDFRLSNTESCDEENDLWRPHCPDEWER